MSAGFLFRWCGCWAVWLACCLAVSGQEAADAGLDTVRERLRAELLEKLPDSGTISKLVAALQPDGTWPGINYTDTSRTGFEHRRHLEYLLSLAKVHAAPHAPFFRDQTVKAAFDNAYAHWLQQDYRCENWWWNEIGTPGAMADILLLMEGSMDSGLRDRGLAIADRANLAGFGARPGGDLIKMAGIMARVALVRRDAAALKAASEVMADQIAVTTGRGIKPDFSFHHRTDGVTSVLTYGRQYAATYAHWCALLSGTRFAFPEKATRLLTDYYLDGIRRTMPFGRYLDPGARNRDLSRKSPAGPVKDLLAAQLLQTARYRQEELRKPDLRYNRYFWHSHYHTHQRPDFFASVRMYSGRSRNMESPYNEEGLKNHFFADGSLFITRTGREYDLIFPVWDWRKIPGTTVVQVTPFPDQRSLVKKGMQAFVGGVTDSIYGMAAMDFESPHSGLSARKAWFFFDREIVCLGTGIEASGPHRVATTLNQCLLRGDVLTESGPAGDKGERLLHSRWIWHDSVGYVFPEPRDVWLKNDTAKGTWHAINRQSWATRDTVQKEVFSLWLDHGAAPRDEAYAYAVLPAASPGEVNAYSRDAGTEILYNNAALQAVRHAKLGITALVCYEPLPMTRIHGAVVQTDQPCLLMLHTKNGRVTRLVAADPSQSMDELNITLNNKLYRISLPGAGMAGSSVMIVP